MELYPAGSSIFPHTHSGAQHPIQTLGRAPAGNVLQYSGTSCSPYSALSSNAVGQFKSERECSSQSHLAETSTGTGSRDLAADEEEPRWIGGRGNYSSGTTPDRKTCRNGQTQSTGKNKITRADDGLQ